MHRTGRNEIVAFAGLEADLTTGVLRRGGVRLPLQEKVFRLLAVLLQRPGEVVRRDDLRRLLWPEGTFVDFDHNINNAVAKLRQTLASAGAGGELIETHGSHGYRFVGSPRRLHASEARTAANGRVKLAVLPLAPLDGEAGEEHLAAGITEELIAMLGACAPERLGVIARTSVLKYAGTVRSIAQIGRDLHVRLVVEGTVQLIAGRAHVSLQLIEARDQTQLWSSQYDYEAADPLRVQISVAEKAAPRIAELLLERAGKGLERILA